jgi:hypothetical protein
MIKSNPISMFLWISRCWGRIGAWRVLASVVSHGSNDGLLGRGIRRSARASVLSSLVLTDGAVDRPEGGGPDGEALNTRR